MRLEDVAVAAGVSPVTARKALRNESTVRPYLKDRVVKAAARLGYKPNMTARNLKQTVSNMVSISVPFLDNPYFGSLTRYLITALHQRGYEALVADRFEKSFDHSVSYNSCGTILAASSISEAEAKLLRKRNQCVVTIGAQKAKLPGVPDVSFNYGDAYHKLTETVIRLGRSKVAFMFPQAEFQLYKLIPATEALHAHGLEPVVDYNEGFHSVEALANYLKEHPKSIDVLFCRDDICTAQTLAVINQAGLRIPEDIILIGCDGIIPLNSVWTVGVDTKQMAAKTVELFDLSLKGEQVTDQIFIEPEIKITH